MISTNVMSFMKKIVKSGNSGGEEIREKPSAINKLKQTVTLGMTLGRDKPKPIGEDLAYLTAEERSILNRVWQKEKEFEKESQKFRIQSPQSTPQTVQIKEKAVEKPQTPVNVPSGPNCRICRKIIEPGEQRNNCDECGQVVCDDCASYSKTSANQSQGWKCSFCRRRQGQDRLGIEPPPGSGMHRVPSVRRMAEKLARTNKEVGIYGSSEKLFTKEGAVLLEKRQQSTHDVINKDYASCLTPFNPDSKETSNKNIEEESPRSLRKHLSLEKSQDSRTRRETKSSVKRQKSIEDRRRSGKTRNSSPVGRDQSKERYYSSETPSDRRSSSESQKGPIHPLPVHNPARVSSYGVCSLTSHQHSHGTEQSSPSESSLDEMSQSPEYDKRRKYRVKRKSKIQRQKNYIEEPDSDPCGYRDERARSNATSSLESSSALESIDNGLDYWPKEYKNSSEKPLRQIASDAALYVRRFSSESSDISDVSGEYSTSDRSGKYISTSTKRQRSSQKHPRRRRDIVSPVVMDSSPSADEQIIEHRTPAKSSSLDDTDRSPKGATTQLRKSIPCVYVDSVADLQTSRRNHVQDHTEWDYQRRSSTGRALPAIPDGHSFLLPHTRTQSTHSLDLPREEVGRPERRASAPERENIKIVIDDVDSEQKGRYGRQTYLRNILIRRDPNDEGARTKGFGMRVMGGKNGDDGRLYAQISWIVPGSAVEKHGLKPGDKIIKWNTECLTDKTYEEVSSIMERSSDVVELLVEVSGRTKSFDSISTIKTKIAPKLIISTEGYKESDVSVVSPTRRKLPKTPDQLGQQHSAVCGEVGVQIWYNQDGNDLVVTVLAARGLRRRKSSSAALPRAFAKIRLVPHSAYNTMKTAVAEPTCNPEWSKTFIFPEVTSDDILESVFELSIWDHCPLGSNVFLGELQLPLRKADLQDCPEWYPLSTHQQTPVALSPTHKITPPSLVPSTPAHDIARRMLQRGTEEYSQSLTYDEIKDESSLPPENKNMQRSSSMDLTLLHPDDAWDRHPTPPSGGNQERKPSAPSVVTRVKSTPPSRRSSNNLVSQDSLPELYGTGPKVKERVRSASFRVYRSADSDSEKGDHKKLGQLVKRKLSRTLSLKSDKDKRSVALGSLIVPPEQRVSNLSSPELTPDSDTGDTQNRNPGQIIPKRFSGNALAPKLGEIKLGFVMTKGQLEVDVVCAKGLANNSNGNPPDTYVKTYLKDEDRQMQKRKTKVARHSTDPQYRQTLKYNASEVFGRTLLVMIWERQKGFEHNQALGATEIQLDKLELSKLTVGWYQLFPYSHIKAESTEST
ncbi:regulating synaptic membrane exocytosis protein 2-like isoform X1 [Centruroides vittatus]|uniref:regulating synaptic membrane exocytosis protein 2-like isoform X1 n=1 Tax=Centruroides vittatus TaxID=120091 RepID=UPI00350EE74A